MATAATVAPSGAPKAGSPAGQAVTPVVPFIRASGEHRENMLDVTRAMTTSDQDLGVFDVPAYGYLRSIMLIVDVTGGAGTSVTLTPDSPFNLLKNIYLQEPNGATIAQFNSGYDLYLANKYGGYRFGTEPKLYPKYSTSVGANANASFMLRIPCELSLRDGLGSLPNQDSAANFKLRLQIASSATVFGGTVTTQPNVRVRAFIEAWDQPPSSTAGAVNQTMPPAVNTTQYWSPQVYNVSAGAGNPRLTRMGNYLRNLVFVSRDATGARINSFPDPVTLMLDSRPKDVVILDAWRQQIYERYGYSGAVDSPNGPDSGVWPYDFCHEFDGQVGTENRDLWLPTLGSTRLEVSGNFPSNGTLTVLTNDVSVAGTVFV